MKRSHERTTSDDYLQVCVQQQCMGERFLLSLPWYLLCVCVCALHGICVQ